jgi:hypothetical protein
MKKIRRRGVVARGKRAKFCVFIGVRDRTKAGLRKVDLVRSNKNKIVSKKKQLDGKKKYVFIKVWTAAVQKARKELRLTGFVAVNGKSVLGRALYQVAKSYYDGWDYNEWSE